VDGDRPVEVADASRTRTGHLELVDPRELRTATNVRTDLRMEKGFVDSIRQHGILEPIVGHRGPDGVVTIAYGHRRAAAAVEAGLSAVPTLIHDTDPTAQTGADRVIAQIVENDHREALSTAERVGAYRQLAAFGLSPTQIARRSSTRKTDVEQALKVASSELATAATARYDLTLDEAAVVSEFAAEKEAVKALVAGAKTGQFAHIAQRLRDQRDYDSAVADLTGQLTEQGVTILESRPDTGSSRGSARRLDEITHDGKPLNGKQHKKCPGHAAYLERSWDEQLVRPVWVCRDARGNGHTDLHPRGTTAQGAGAELTEEEKAERRQVRQNNTDWRSAETVRRDFLRHLLARKTPPTGTRRYLAESLILGDHAVRRALERGHPLAREMLGLDPAFHDLADVLDGVTEPRAEVIALGSVLSAYEDATGVHTWRNPDRATRRYLDFLHGAGYQLSPLEQSIASPAPPTEINATPPRTSRQPKTEARGGVWVPSRPGAAAADPERPPPSVA
jgi:ParB family chromosome partitioning protein